MDTKHSPEPWAVLDGHACKNVYSVPLSPRDKTDTPHIGGLVAIVYGHHDESGTSFSLQSNLNLIAAAPELLAALKEAVNRWDNYRIDDTEAVRAARTMAIAAIAKAEGR